MKTVLFNKKSTKKLRKELRQQDVVCEKIMWSKLRNKQLGYKFRRQYSVGNFVVDFYCPKLELIVEIDGATHGTEKEINYDRFRQKYLEENNLVVKRYTNIEVRKNIYGVLDDLRRTCKEIESYGFKTYLTPDPSPCEGEGERID